MFVLKKLSAAYLSVCQKLLPNRFHVAVHLFSHRSQKMSKCGEIKKGDTIDLLGECQVSSIACCITAQ